MKLVIIESPYAGDITANMSYLDACMRDCIGRGESPYASHRMLTSALDDNDPEQRRACIEAGYAWWEAADTIVFYVDRGVSSGMLKAAQRWTVCDEAIDAEIRTLGNDLAQHEQQIAKLRDILFIEQAILEECAGLRTPRPWGAAVGAVLENLRAQGLLDAHNKITAKGRERANR